MTKRWKLLQVRLTPNEQRLADWAAEQSGTTVSAMVRELLLERVNDERELLALAPLRKLDSDTDGSGR